jgi:hypothetical protein
MLRKVQVHRQCYGSDFVMCSQWNQHVAVTLTELTQHAYSMSATQTMCAVTAVHSITMFNIAHTPAAVHHKVLLLALFQ